MLGSIRGGISLKGSIRETRIRTFPIVHIAANRTGSKKPTSTFVRMAAASRSSCYTISRMLETKGCRTTSSFVNRITATSSKVSSRVAMSCNPDIPGSRSD